MKVISDLSIALILPDICALSYTILTKTKNENNLVILKDTEKKPI